MWITFIGRWRKKPGTEASFDEFNQGSQNMKRTVTLATLSGSGSHALRGNPGFPTLRVESGDAERRRQCVPTQSMGTRGFNMKRTIALVILAILSGQLSAEGAGTATQYTRELPADYRHRTAFYDNQPGSLFGPRIAWAEPFVLGKLKLLIVLPISASREAVELQSRIPAEVSLITMQTPNNWATPGGEPDYDPVPSAAILNDTAQRLLSAGYHYDAILIGKVRWTAIPQEIRRKILEKVRAGASLVLVTPWDIDADLKKEMNLSGVDNPLRKSFGRACRWGCCRWRLTTRRHRRRILPHGASVRSRFAPGSWAPARWRGWTTRTSCVKDGKRTVLESDPWRFLLDGIALTPFAEGDDLYYEYYFSILGKLLYQVAGKTAALEVRGGDSVVTACANRCRARRSTSRSPRPTRT